MAYSQTDIDNLKKALATGVLEVETSDGKRTRFRSLDEIQRIIASMETEIAPPDSPPASGRTVISRLYTRKGF